MKRCIIALSSDLPRMGKDTFASNCSVRLNLCKFESFSFAHVLKQEVAKHYNLDEHLLMTDAAYKDLHRDKLISFSNDKREENPDIWVDHVIAKLDKYFAEQPAETLANWEGAQCAAITDVRYANEITKLRRKYENDECKVVHVHITVTDIMTMYRRMFADKPIEKWADYLRLIDDISERELQTFHLYIPPETKDDPLTWRVEKNRNPIFTPDFLLYNDYSLLIYTELAKAVTSQIRLQYDLVRLVQEPAPITM